MIHRRTALPLLAGMGLAGLSVFPTRVWADRAGAFIKSTGDRLVSVVNAGGPAADKRRDIGKIILSAVDVESIGRFCLGRFWRQASAEQQKTYQTLFQDVLITSITAKLGEYQGVRFTMGRTRAQEEEQVVTTVVERPNNPPATVEWVVTRVATDPKIVDVIAEGTSLRITQRSDYASFLSRNNSSIDALLAAMRKQIEAG